MQLGVVNRSGVAASKLRWRFGRRYFFVLALLLLLFKNRSFFSLAPRSGCGTTISAATVRTPMVFFNSVSADRIVMAATRFLGAAAVCALPLSFAAGHCKSYQAGCMKVAMVIRQQIFSILSLMIFLSNFLYKVLQNQNRIFSLWRRDPVVDGAFSV